MKKEDNNRTPRMIRYGYLSNTVYFVPDNLSLTIRVDFKKEKHPRKRKPTKARLAQIQEDKENFIWLFQQNQSDFDSFKSKYDMTTDFHHRNFQLTESDMLSGKITPLNNVLSGASITLKYGEGLFEFLNTDFSSAYEAVRKELSGCQVPDEYHTVAQQYAFTMRKLRPLAVPRFLHVDYRFSSLEELLNLEFTKMLDLNLRYTKCRRCGRYFPLKGNREAKYCEYIAEGETKTCRELAIQENYRAKAADKPERKIYSKYYKRYSARIKTGQITEEKFREWKYTAMTKRNECTDGKLTIDELEAWMETCFTNRKKTG